MTRTEMITELTSIQNDERNWNRDILTITGFMSDNEVFLHLQRCARAVKGEPLQPLYPN